jgi:hypothetical protein
MSSVNTMSSTLYKEASALAKHANATYNKYFQTVKTPTQSLRPSMDVARKLVLADPMVFNSTCSTKRSQVFMEVNPILASTNAHLSTSAPHALKRYSPALSARLTFAVTDGMLCATAQFENEEPNIIAFLLLYTRLQASDRLSKDFDDADPFLRRSILIW